MSDSVGTDAKGCREDYHVNTHTHTHSHPPKKNHTHTHTHTDTHTYPSLNFSSFLRRFADNCGSSMSVRRAATNTHSKCLCKNVTSRWVRERRGGGERGAVRIWWRSVQYSCLCVCVCVYVYVHFLALLSSSLA